ncbi:hypothetical protein PENTCL1PPCAC_7817, partial [Pristionchus entomophagus]
QLEHAFHEKTAVERSAHEEKMRLEREKSEVLIEKSEENLRLVQESNDRQRILLREAEEKRFENEKSSREAELRLRQENEQQSAMERVAAREREERAQMEIMRAIHDANRGVSEMKDKAHAEITQLIMENQKRKDELMKDNLMMIKAKDAANTQTLDKLTTNFQSQVKEAQDLAKQREDVLHFERKAVDEKYRKDMENMSKMSKEERVKMTNDYHKMIKDKDEELNRNQ